jgi:hypothetical protein
MKRGFWVQWLCSFRDKLKSAIQNLKWLGLSMIAFVLVVAKPVAEAQQPEKVPRIGHFTATFFSAITARTKAFRQGLHELGYLEGKTSSLSGDLQRENQIECPRL